MLVNKHIKHSHFIAHACKLTFLLLIYFLHWLFENKYCKFKSVSTETNIKLTKEQDWSLKGIWHSLSQNTIIAVDGSSYGSNAAFVAKM